MALPISPNPTEVTPRFEPVLITGDADNSLTPEALFDERNGLVSFDPSSELDDLTHKIADGYLDARLQFVKLFGWRSAEETSDVDEYDTNTSIETVSCVKVKPTDTQDGAKEVEPSVVAGLRLTRVPDVPSSMSFHMLGENPALQAEVEEASAHNEDITRATQSGRLWDLTRLIGQVDGSASGVEISKGIQELFGVGVEETCPDNSYDSAWFFVVTEDMKGFLDKLGIEYDIMAKGYVSQKDAGNGNTSYVCYTNPGRAYENLGQQESSRSRRAFELMEQARDITGRLIAQ